MKNKKILVLSALVLLTILALGFIAYRLSKSNGGSDNTLLEFAIKDTSKIDKITIKDKLSNSITLRKVKGQWQDEKGQCVRRENINFILDAAKHIEFKGYLGEKAKKTFTNILKTQHVRVEFFEEDESLKTWFIGPPAQDHLGQIMLLETPTFKGQYPVVMRIKGLSGIIEPRFFASREEWACSGIFALKDSDIQSVDVKNIENPKRSFTVARRNKSFAVTSNAKPIPRIDTTNVYRYLQGFKKINWNTKRLDLKDQQVDSIKRSIPFCEVRVTEVKGKTTLLKLYRIKSAEPRRNELGESVPYDMDYLWALLPSGELVKCQYFVFNNILTGHVYFPELLKMN